MPRRGDARRRVSGGEGGRGELDDEELLHAIRGGGVVEGPARIDEVLVAGEGEDGAVDSPLGGREALDFAREGPLA